MKRDIKYTNIVFIKGLKHNLLTISQFYDKGNPIIFNRNLCLIISDNDKQIKLIGKRIDNIYMIDLKFESIVGTSCLINMNGNSWI